MSILSSDSRALRFGLLIMTAGLLVAGPVRAGQLDVASFFLIDTGMEESEVLILAGPPDLVTSPTGEILEVYDGSFSFNPDEVSRFDAVRRVHVSSRKRWHYIPDSSEHDPHLTVITMKNGKVFDVERKKILSRAGLPKPRSEKFPRRQVPSDDEIVRRRLQRTLDAAEHYARTRSRLKRDDIELKRAAADLPELTVNNTDDRVYRSIDDDGVVYYGDRPPDAGRMNIVDY